MKTNKLTFYIPTSRWPVIRAVGKRLFSALAALLLCGLPIRAATIVWTNTAGGNWNATNNWSPNQVPTAADEAVITNAGSYTVTLNANATVASLQLGAVSGTQTLHCATTTLTVNGPGLIGTNGAFTLAGGTLAGTGTLTVEGRCDWTSGTWQGAGQTTFAPTAIFNLSGSGQKFLRDRMVTIGCNATWSSGQWYGGYGAVVNLQSGATLDVGSESGAPVWAGAITFNNAGTIRKSTGIGQGYFNWTVNNGGLVDAQTGTLGFYGGGTQTGFFQTAGASTRIHFGGGTHDLRAGADFTGAGLFTIGDNGTVRTQSPLTNGMRWQLLNGGVLGGTNAFTFTGPFDWQAGTMQDSGQTIFSPTATLTLSTTGQKFLRDRTVTIGCNTTWSGGQWYGGYGAVVNLQAGATLDVGSEAGAPVWAGAITFNNAGTLRKSTGTGTSSFNWTVTNTAAVRAQNGTLAFNGIYVQRSGSTTLAGGNLGGATLDLQGGVLTGAGNVAANVLNRADVFPGGPFGFLGVSNSPAVIYSNTAAGRFNVQLAGLTPGVDYDQLRITGTANLAGTLNVEFLDGFVPAVGNSFTVMTYTARSGAFTNLAAPEGVTLQPVYYPNQLVLNAVAFTQVPPYLVTQPTNVTVRQGLTASFRVVAGGSPTLHYQWQMNSTNLPGATGDTLVIPNVALTNAGSYRVFVSNDGGFTNSLAALVLVEPGFNTVEITTGTTNALTGVSFFNGLEGAIIGVGGWLQITHNGGVTWQVVNTGMTEIRDVQFVGGAIYIVGTGPHTICVSYDGGLTWAPSYSGPEVIHRLGFLSPGYGFAVGDAGAVLFWSGTSWTPMTTGIPVNLWSLDFCGGIPVAVGEAGRIYRFEGTNWVLRYTAVSLATLNDVRFCGFGGAGFAVGTGGVIYRTTDCGLTWDLYNNPPYSGALNSIAFGNCGTWWIGGDGGTLLISTDGGLSWQTLYTGTTNRITSVVFVDGYGYYVDDSGHCYHFEYAPIPPNAPPLVAIVLPAGPQTNWACTPLVLRAQAADSDGFVTDLQFLADGQPLTQDNPAIYTHCNLGVVTYTATATDNRGARGISGPVKVTYVPAPLHQLIPAGFLGAETNRGFQLCLTGEVGRDYQLFAHTNVAAPFATWELLGLMTPTNQLYRFRDYDATNLPHRFYRARQVPNP